jgi:hypothetical protein
MGGQGATHHLELPGIEGPGHVQLCRILVWFGMAMSFVRLPWGRVSFAPAFGLALFAVIFAGCESHECTTMGCTSQLSITMRTPTGAWSDGVYELTVRTDTQLEGVCTFRLPDQLPDPPGKVPTVPCGTGIRWGISPEVECQMGCNGDSCWQGCTPIPGKFLTRVTIDGTPGRVDLQLSRDGAPILVETAEPVYADVYPNGPECGGACRQASLEYTLP